MKGEINLPPLNHSFLFLFFLLFRMGRKKKKKKEWRAGRPFAYWEVSERTNNEAKQDERTNKLNFFFNLIDGVESIKWKEMCLLRERGPAAATPKQAPITLFSFRRRKEEGELISLLWLVELLPHNQLFSPSSTNQRHLIDLMGREDSWLNLKIKYIITVFFVFDFGSSGGISSFTPLINRW